MYEIRDNTRNQTLTIVYIFIALISNIYNKIGVFSRWTLIIRNISPKYITTILWNYIRLILIFPIILRNIDCYSQDNKKAIGKFKYELNGELATEFIGMKKKSILKNPSKKRRSVQKESLYADYVRQKIKHEDHLQCLQIIFVSLQQLTTSMHGRTDKDCT